ncbi:Mor transcription activator family protein [Carnobacterium pleistocenium]|uniref:Mor transcription activator family protein n=1 Tax=Carnobacterium pleistocenium TaxID=181073 RepID=UPI00055724BA|nr:Mor transcription activator family protein [Carnobacterium pleistocenium]
MNLVSIAHDYVIEVIGEDKFNELCEKYAGHTLYFPKKRNPFNTTNERNEWIFKAFMSGRGYEFIANEVGLQRDTVIRIIKECTKTKKESLK